MLADHELRANVVDVRRFSTHDGTGIRTTIFLMGCSLACQWCQNPEAIEGRLRPVFFPTRCIQCGLCVEHATNGEASWGTDGKVRVDTTREANWEHLASVCPTKAITFNGTTHTVEELVSMALRDRVFYGNGGGVTISGGEPLFWPHFTARLLERLRQEGVHTAIETALNVRQEFVAACLPVVNLVYADLKLIDPASHQRWIGHDNAQILRNVEYLLTSVRRHDVIMRTPLIPGITATDDNIHAIAQLVSRIYPDVKYELLNYNPLAAAKYDVIPDRDYVFDRADNPPMLTAEEMDHFRDVARQAGVRNLVVE